HRSVLAHHPRTNGGLEAAPTGRIGGRSSNVRLRVFRQPSRYPVHASYRPSGVPSTFAIPRSCLLSAFPALLGSYPRARSDGPPPVGSLLGPRRSLPAVTTSGSRSRFLAVARIVP